MYSNQGWTESHSAATRGHEWRQRDYKGRISQPLRLVVMEMLFWLWGWFPGCVHTSELTTL